ncbi:uncharacterized protein LOC129717489 [Wyeomyia smithii]|uniref:uncharacterized protein LOC129717489 n=1 Tax=Wyeomyia smithii TaxID=174621 RepID=UPI002467FFD5|nr:uncharacterized protein LOC129717489 [Wyeomyia smithii]
MSANGNDLTGWVYVGNIMQRTEEEAIRRKFPGADTLIERCTNASYHPNKIALLKFSTREDQQQACSKDIGLLSKKRILVFALEWNWTFSPKTAVMVKNLDKRFEENILYDSFQVFGEVAVVLKPTFNYAYVAFSSPQSARKALEQRRMKDTIIEIFPLQRDIPMAQALPEEPFQTIKEKCQAFGLKYDSLVESQRQLLVTNIPRYADEDDVLQYLKQFGTIKEWKMFPSTYSVLTNNGLVIYETSAMSCAAYLHSNHFFQGVALEIYYTIITYNEIVSTQAVLLKNTSIYLTNEEIYTAFSLCGPIAYLHRADTRRRTIVRFQSAEAAQRALNVERIAEEDVFVSLYTEENYNATGALTDLPLKPSALRNGKQELVEILAVIEAQSLIETTQSFSYYNPQPEIYKNEVQVMNFPNEVALVDFRKHFLFHGLVEHVRYASVHGFSRQVAYLSFATGIEARRACSMNQTMMYGHRLVVFMACERLLFNPELTVLVTKLDDAVTDEMIYDRMNQHSPVKFVIRLRGNQAVVTFHKQSDPLDEKLHSAKHDSIVHLMAKLYSLQQAATVDEYLETLMPVTSAEDDAFESTLPEPNNELAKATSFEAPLRTVETGVFSATTEAAKAPIVGAPIPSLISNQRSVAPPRNKGNQQPIPPSSSWESVPFAMAFSNPLLAPATIVQHTPGILLPNVMMFAPPENTSQQELPPITPAMLMLMQKVETLMQHIPTFTNMPMTEQFHLINSIVNYIITRPNYFEIPQEARYAALLAGQHGFRYAHVLYRFTRAHALQLLSLIEADYVETVNKAMVQAEPAPETVPQLTDMEKIGLVAAVSEQFQQIPRLVEMNMTDKVNFLLGGFNGFKCAELFARLTPPQQIELIENLQLDYTPTVTDPPETTANAATSTPAAIQEVMPLTNNHKPPPPEPVPPVAPVINPALPFYSQPCNNYLYSQPLERHSKAEVLEPRPCRVSPDYRRPPVYDSRMAPRPRYPDRYRQRSPSRSSSDSEYGEPSSRHRRTRRRFTRSRSRSRSRSRCRDISRSRSRTRSPPRWSSSESETGESSIRNTKEPQPIVLVSHVDVHVSKEKLTEKLAQFGQVLSIIPSPSRNGWRRKIKRVYVEFDTYNQALQALALHLTLFRGHLLRVRFANQRRRSAQQMLYAVKVTYLDPRTVEPTVPRHELRVLERFRKHGPIVDLYSRDILNYMVVFKHITSVTTALKEDYMRRDVKCVVTRMSNVDSN